MSTTNLAYPMDQKFLQLMDKMLKTKLRIDDYLDSLVILMSSSKITQASRIDRSLIYSMIKKESNVVRLFKLCILVERCMVKGYVRDCGDIVDAVVQRVEKVEELWDYQDEGDGQGNTFQRFLVKKVIRPFLVYLQKRAYDDKITNQSANSYDFSNFLEDKHCDQNPQLFQTNKTQLVNTIKNNPILQPTQNISSNFACFPQKQQKIQKSLQNTFYIINLLNKILTFCPSMLPLIRYFGGYFGCILDFNITLAMDIQILYNRLGLEIIQIEKYMKYIKEGNNGKEGGISGERQQQILGQIDIIMEEIDKINQAIYIVYYNCYYYKSMSYYVPNFINTDKFVTEIKNIRKMNENQKKWTQISNRSRVFSKDIKARANSMKKSTFSTVKPKNMINSTFHNKYLQQIPLTQSFKYNFSHHQQITKQILQKSTQQLQIQSKILNNCNKQKLKQKQKNIRQIQLQATRSSSLKQSTNSKYWQQHQQQYLFQFVDSEQEQQQNDQQSQSTFKNIQKLEQNLSLLVQMSQTLENMCRIQQNMKDQCQKWNINISQW